MGWTVGGVSPIRALSDDQCVKGMHLGGGGGILLRETDAVHRDFPDQPIFLCHRMAMDRARYGRKHLAARRGHICIPCYDTNCTQ